MNRLESILALVADRLPPCVFHHVTGYPCPTCGATRAILAVAGGRFREAFLLNPLVVSGGVIFFGWLLAGWMVYGVTGRFPSPRLSPRTLWPVRIAVVLLVLVNWAYLVMIGV